MIQSNDNLIAAFGNGRTNRYDWNKITGAAAYALGRWYNMAGLGGIPVATTWPGTALACVDCTDAAGDGTNKFGIPHGGDVSTMIKHLITGAAWTTAAAGVPGTLYLVDVNSYWPGINMNVNTLQTLTGTPTLRYANGAGMRMFLSALATTGATGHNLAYSYTNQDGTAGRTQPVTVACTASAIVPHIVHSGVAANNYGPFLPLASGDSGIRSVESVQLSAASGTASTAVLVLCRMLAQITLSQVGLMTEKDFLNQIPSLPRIPDGACLALLYGAGANTVAATTFAGSFETVWG
jgi:hypothetical protein